MVNKYKSFVIYLSSINTDGNTTTYLQKRTLQEDRINKNIIGDISVKQPLVCSIVKQTSMLHHRSLNEVLTYDGIFKKYTGRFDYQVFSPTDLIIGENPLLCNEKG